MKRDDSKNNVEKLPSSNDTFSEFSDGASTYLINSCKTNKNEENIDKAYVQKNLINVSQKEERSNTYISSVLSNTYAVPPQPPSIVCENYMDSSSMKNNNIINPNNNGYDSSNYLIDEGNDNKIRNSIDNVIFSIVSRTNNSDEEKNKNEEEISYINSCERCYNFLFGWKAKFLEKIGDFFGSYAAIVNHYPWLVS